ncbi:putative hydrolase R7 [Paramyrothecium foliicola]|nr:putative hydrolase R7 [Paramyrothecium foliicola]
MSSSNLPLILLVPGAFGTPASFDKLLPYLHNAGFTTKPGPYPSCNPPDPTTATCLDDIESLRDNVLLPLLDEQKNDVVILAHSYGGVVAGAAAKGLDRQTRRQNGQGVNGVIGLVYVAGNITLEGESLLEAVGGAYPPFIKLGNPSEGLAIVEPAMDVFYNDVDPSLEPELSKLMNGHAHRAFETKATAPAWADSAFDGRRAYVRTEDDHCNPAFLQDIWLEKSKVEWDVVTFKTGHFPFVSQPEALAAQVVSFTNSFLTA